MIEDVAAYQQPWPSFAPHSAAKAAQAMLTESLREPSRRRCACAEWLPVRSQSSPARRSGEPQRHSSDVGSPEDVANAVLYLAGADFVTGTSLVVDGGRLLQSKGPRTP